MIFDYPLENYIVHEVDSLNKNIFFTNLDKEIYLDQHFFQISNVQFGTFQVKDGKEIYLKKSKNFKENIAKIYFNGSVFSAVLHQRKILHLHASSFEIDGKAILICGESESGKSTTTLSFCLDGAIFLTDDIAPIVFENSIPKVQGYSKRFKIWTDTFKKLNLNNFKNKKIYDEHEKYFFDYSSKKELVEVAYVFILGIGEKLNCIELHSIQKFEALREEIFRKEYLDFMHETEKSYMKSLIDLVKKTRVFRLERPFEINPIEIKKIIKSIITNV